MKELVERLIENKKTISTMESCTGGGVANAITNVEGASEILKYSVYSMETAHEMSEKISAFAGSDYGVGITGKLNRVDVNNPYGKDNVVFVSVYDSNAKEHYDSTIKAVLASRAENKELVIREIEKIVLQVLDNDRNLGYQKVKSSNN